jgi:Autophagocytosis associated protein, active-site domain
MVTSRGDYNQDSWKKEEPDISEESVLEDNSISVDTQVIQADPAKGSADVSTLWSFSIAYSSTYRVPVLYFQVNSLNGDPCGRHHVLEMLRGTVEIPKETWEFVSQEEHPCSGLPSFFLHPCQSSQRLRLMAIANSLAGAEGNHATRDALANDTILWAWMSMILPFVGHAIPALYYVKIGHCMAQLSKSEISIPP